MCGRRTGKHTDEQINEQKQTQSCNGLSEASSAFLRVSWVFPEDSPGDPGFFSYGFPKGFLGVS